MGTWPETEVLAYMQQGSIVSTDHYWREGMPEWRSCSELVALRPPPPHVPFSLTRSTAFSASPLDEKPLLEVQPSQWLNFGYYSAAGLLCLLLVTIPFCLIAMLGRWLSTRAVLYTVTNQRLGFKCGVFSKTFQQIELFRVEDLIVETPFFQGLFKIGTIRVVTGDKTRPQICLRGVREPERVCETLRTHVVMSRQANGVIAIENLR